MKKDDIRALIEDSLNDAELKSKDIPAIDLYVDQILNIVSDKLSEGSERYRERQLTKTMINNYSKDGLLSPVNGKKYNKEQILQILTVYSLKNTLSIGDIKRILYAVSNSENSGGKQLTEIYDRHIDIKYTNRELAENIFFDLVSREGLDLDDKADYAIAVAALASLSAQFKNMVLAMIDGEFPIPPEDKESKKEKEPKREKVKEEKPKKEKKKKDAPKEAQ